MDWTDNILNFYAILNILLGIYNLWVRNKTGNILTAVSGFHLTYIMFLGVGFLAYTNYDTIYDSIGRDEVLRQLEKIAPYLLIGYSVVSYLENRKRINDGIERKNTEINLREFNSNFFSSFFLILPVKNRIYFVMCHTCSKLYNKNLPILYMHLIYDHILF